MAASGTPEEVLTPELLREIYEVEAEVARDSRGCLRIFSAHPKRRGGIDMREAILAVSFGTTVDQARSRDRVEGGGRRCPPPPRSCPSSGPTPAVWSGRGWGPGIAVPDVAGALEQMAAEGIECPLIVPTHLLPGAEYDKIRKTAARWEGRFPALRLSRPLLGTPEDLRELGGALMDLIPPAEGGPDPVHGPQDPQIRRPGLPGPPGHLPSGRAGRPGGGHGGGAGPGWREVLPLVTAPAVELVPLMLVAGDHALHDMAGRGRTAGKGSSRAGGMPCPAGSPDWGPAPGTGPLCPPPGGASGRVLREETCRGKGAADAGALHYCGREAPALRTTTGTCAAMAAAGAVRLLPLTGRAPDLISLNTPRDWMVEAPLLDCVADGETAACSVEKDGGR